MIYIRTIYTIYLRDFAHRVLNKKVPFKDDTLLFANKKNKCDLVYE